MRGRLALLSVLVIALLGSAGIDRTGAAQHANLETAKTTAWQLSVLESQSDWNSLYDWMHPDSQLTVGRDTVAYWYRTYFAVDGPNPATITGAKLVNWTWEVTGRTYPATAEVSFTQVFDNGSVIDDVVRLVRGVDGTWRWFFGRSPEFVRQIAQEAGEQRDSRSIPERAGVPPASLFAESIVAIERVTPACFVAAGIGAAPASIGNGSISSNRSESGARTESAFYMVPNRSEFPDLIANALTLATGETLESIVQKTRENQVNWDGPPYTGPPRGLVTDLAPTSPYLIFYYEESNEAVGYIPVLMWGPRQSNTVFAVVGPAAGLINELVAGWSQNARTSCVG